MFYVNPYGSVVSYDSVVPPGPAGQTRPGGFTCFFGNRFEKDAIKNFGKPIKTFSQIRESENIQRSESTRKANSNDYIFSNPQLKSTINVVTFESAQHILTYGLLLKKNKSSNVDARIFLAQKFCFFGGHDFKLTRDGEIAFSSQHETPCVQKLVPGTLILTTQGFKVTLNHVGTDELVAYVVDGIVVIDLIYGRQKPEFLNFTGSYLQVTSVNVEMK